MRARSIISLLTVLFVVSVYPPLARAQSGEAPAWVNLLKGKMVEHICKDGGAWLECYGQRPSDCPLIARNFIYSCIDKSARNAPATVTSQIAAELSKSMVECFNSTFETEYGAWQKRTPECLKPPQHLQ